MRIQIYNYLAERSLSTVYLLLNDQAPSFVDKDYGLLFIYGEEKKGIIISANKNNKNKFYFNLIILTL